MEITENTVVDKPHIEKIKSPKPEVVKEVSSDPVKKRHVNYLLARGQAELKTSATGDPSVQTSENY